MPKSKAVRTSKAVILSACLFIFVWAVATSHNSNSSANLQSDGSNNTTIRQQEIQNCENTTQNQLYHQLAAQEQVGGISGNLVNTFAQLAIVVQRQQLRCEAGLPAD